MVNQILTATQVLGRELRTTRTRKGWTQAELATRMQQLGFEGMDQPMVARSERGQRTVSLDETLGFALALGVPPMSLVLPRGPEEQIRVALDVTMPARNVAAWWREADPLIDPEEPWAPARRFFDESCTDIMATVRRELPEAAEIYRMSAQLVSFYGFTNQVADAMEVIFWLAAEGLRRTSGDPERAAEILNRAAQRRNDYERQFSRLDEEGS
jgi:transcriptional regulator with XRE-family HTH domain